MSSNTPFVEPATGELDTNQILLEAIPLGKLVALVVAISLVPFVPGEMIFESSVVGTVLVAVSQFLLAVGSGIVLIYVIVRGLQLADR